MNFRLGNGNDAISATERLMGETRYSPGADLDRDGVVGPQDLAILTGEIGRRMPTGRR